MDIESKKTCTCQFEEISKHINPSGLVHNRNCSLSKEDKMSYRFRSSIYIETIIENNISMEEARAQVHDEVTQYASIIPNAYVGDTALYDPFNIEQVLDREI